MNGRGLAHDRDAALYGMLMERGRAASHRVQRVCMGLSWSALQAEHIGICFSPEAPPRTLPWSGALVGRMNAELVAMLTHGEPAEASLGSLALNAAINGPGNAALAAARPLDDAAPPHLRVFAHYKERVRGANVVVVGRYPGLDTLWSDLPYVCIERRPFGDTQPAESAPMWLPRADFAFITASSIPNHTLPALLSLCQDAHVVLMGPSLPWLSELGDFGVDVLAGVSVELPDALWAVVAEAGGTRLFDTAVRYRMLAL